MEEEFVSIEEKLLSNAQKKKRKKRNRKIVKTVFLLCFLCLLVFYMMSDMSKVKSLTVLNNTYYSDEQILEKAKLSYQSNYFLTFRFWVDYQLKKEPLIKNAHMHKDLQQGFVITVEEEKVIGYLQDQPQSVLIQGKGVQSVSDVRFERLPRIGLFRDDQLASLEEAFKNVDADVLSLISEILPHSESYDANMVMLIMNDGNRVSASYEGVELINQYKKILPQLKGTHVCLFMDAISGNIIKQSIDCTKTENAEIHE